VLDRQMLKLDRSGRRLYPELVGQLADLCGRVAVATQGLQERELAFLGPAGHGLGRHLQQVGHLGGRRYRGSSDAVLLLGWAATAHPFHAADPLVMPGPESDAGIRPGTTARPAATMLLAASLVGAGRTGRSCRPTQLPHHSPIGLFQRVCYLVRTVGTAGWRQAVGRNHQHPVLLGVVLD
jgi:hypothetical protein